MRRILAKMQFPQGRIGPTKWATLLFFEFAGVPTYGISFRKSFAKHIIAIPDEMDRTLRLSPMLRRMLGISVKETKNSGLTADGVIVRCASVLNETKYYNEQPGFAYRIHGSNWFASTPRRGRLYLRAYRKRQLIRMLIDTFSIRTPANTTELIDEIRNRAWPIARSRRLRLRAEYCLATLKTVGSFRQKLACLAVALGLVN
jgi:hypothetical protein